MANIQDVSLSKSLTPALAADSRMVSVTDAVEKELLEIAAKRALLYLYANIDNLPEQVINLLAWQWHVDFWDNELSLEQKRNLVKNSIRWHRRKGTPSAVEEVVSAILEGAIVQEWFEYGGEPYHFRVVKINGQVTAEMYPKLKKAVDTVKNTRSWLEGVSLSRNVNSDIFYGIMQGTHTKVDIFPAAFTMPDIEAAHIYGGLLQVHKRQTF